MYHDTFSEFVPNCDNNPIKEGMLSDPKTHLKYLIYFHLRHWKSNLSCPWFITSLFMNVFMCWGLFFGFTTDEVSLCISCLGSHGGLLYMLTTQVFYLFRTNPRYCCQNNKMHYFLTVFFSYHTSQIHSVYQSFSIYRLNQEYFCVQGQGNDDYF